MLYYKYTYNAIPPNLTGTFDEADRRPPGAIFFASMRPTMQAASADSTIAPPAMISA